MQKEDKNDEILNYIGYWKERTGHLLRELIFDLKLTIEANLNRLNQQGVDFMTLHRRAKRMFQ